MSDDENVQTITVGKLSKSGEYIIPIYQRNYAWGTTEVDALIDDIWDSADKESKHYYIGSLVVSERSDGKYEVVDGQQRLTTLKILLAALESSENISLEFESRPLATQALERLGSDDGMATIKSAYQDCLKRLKQLEDKEKFKNYLNNKVTIIQTILPEDTDLNHYFEIMNNRGEQLEKHEVLKARFMESLTDKDAQSAFAKVWDMCSQMDGYVVKHFSSNERKTLFGENLDKCPEGFDAIKKALVPANQSDGDSSEDTSKQDQESGDKKLLDALLEAALSKPIDEGKGKEEYEEPYSSIIKFPNFLLHVLRLIKKEEQPLPALDDKQLLPVFFKDAAQKELYVDAKCFAHALLKCRFLFDRYVIKSHSKGRWTLRSFGYYEDKNKKRTLTENNTFQNHNKDNVMIQAMFHVSYPTQNYKYWLDGLLSFLYGEPEVKDDSLLTYMEALSDRFFFGRFGREEKNYDDILKSSGLLYPEIDKNKLDQGTDVHNFVFNRLDYLLWKEANKDQLSGESIKKINADKFHFTFRSSVEHFYPQNPNNDDDKLEDETLNNFGNLCLISASKNSKLSNYMPKAKQEHYQKGSAIESLKQQLMMLSADDWNEDKIIEHGKNMINLLNGKEV